MTDQAFKMIPLECIRISPHNRKRFNEVALQEMAASIKEKDVLQPIVVRPIPPEGIVAFEIVAGERRYRGSEIAGKAGIPAMVRELTDAQAAEIRSIENLQREDVHPLEEALGYEDLVKNHKYTVQQLADKVGKSKAYIAARLKLCALEPEARKAFFDEKLTLSTALLVARIPVKSLQTKAVKEITQKDWNGESMSAQKAGKHIQHSYMLRLKDAPFKTTDAELLPKVGACTTCPKRTGNQPELFPDVDSADVCTDPECFGRKRDAWAVIRMEEAKAKGQKVIDGKTAKDIFPSQHGSARNGYEELGDKNQHDPKKRTWKQLAKAAGVEPVLVKNPHTGVLVELLKVDELKPHLKELGLVARAGANPANAAENERVRKAKAETAFRQRLFAAIRAKASGQMQKEDWIEVGLRMLARVESNDFKMLLGILGWEKDLNGYSDRDGRLRKKLNALSTEALNDLMRECALIGEVRTNSYSTGKPERLLSAATRYGVDVNAIKAQIKAETDAKKKPAAKKAAAAPVPKKAAAKKAAPAKSAEPACRVCGCTEHNACVTAAGGCHWVEPDLCSACAPKKPAKKKVQSKTAQPVAPAGKRFVKTVLNPAAAWPFPTEQRVTHEE